MNLSIQDELQLFSESEIAILCIWVSQRTASDYLVRLCSQL